MQLTKKLLTVAVATAMLSSCATDDMAKNTKIAAAIGATVGAVIGHQVDHESGRFMGAAIGAVTGAVIGNYMDEQENTLDNELKAEQESKEIVLDRVDKKTIRLRLSSEVSFDVNSANLKPSFDKSLERLVGVFSKYDKTIIHVVGFTDSSGSDVYNQKLSEQRSTSVVNFFKSKGVIAERLKIEGRGEQSPIASNDTAAGRANNRRVEIYVVAVEEGKEDESMESPEV